MPELPEVETIRRQLQAKIVGKKIISADVFLPKAINLSVRKFKSVLKNKKILTVKRRAKVVMLQLNQGYYLLFHLKMSGHLLYLSKMTELPAYAHVVLYLSGQGKICFDDFRKFGFVKLLSESEVEKYFKTTGLDATDKKLNLAKFKNIIASRPNKKIKELLMDQSLLGGIGNIYASEICFGAKVNPARVARNLTNQDNKALYQNTKRILQLAIKKRGTSDNLYTDLYGRKGKFVPLLKVYNREGERCKRCGSTVKKIRLGGRGTYFCPDCQR